MLYYSLFVTILCVFSFVRLYLAFKGDNKLKLKLKDAEAKLKEQIQRGVMQDLQIATTEQMMHEVRNRQEYCIIMYPKNIDDEIDSLKMIISGLNPEQTLRVLNASLVSLSSEIRKGGANIRNIHESTPDYDDYDDYDN